MMSKMFGIAVGVFQLLWLLGWSAAWGASIYGAIAIH